jgi:hypothetical protein
VQQQPSQQQSQEEEEGFVTLEEADLDWGDADVAAVTGAAMQPAAKQWPRTGKAAPLVCACTAPVTAPATKS